MMRWESRTKSERGFTLIELLVVISIITFLMALLFPALRKAKKQAQAVACMAQLRQCGLLVFSAQSDENDRQRIDEAELWSLFREATSTEADETVSCPAAPPLPTSNEPLGPSSLSRDAAWAVPYATYGYNAYLAGAFYPRSARHTDVPLVFDAASNRVMPDHYSEPPAYEGDLQGGRGANRPGMKQVCINRHQGGINMLFLDWAARKIGLKELWTLKWSEDFETNGPWTKAGGVLPKNWPEWMRKFKDY